MILYKITFFVSLTPETGGIAMPNIEIHGFGCGAVAESNSAENADLRRKIFDLFTGKSYTKEMVITAVADDVRDGSGRPQPFLRVVSCCDTHLDEIVELLKTLDMNIEVTMLSAFHPRKSSV